VKNTKVKEAPANAWVPRANECDLQAKNDFENNPNRSEVRYNQFTFSEEGLRQIGRMHSLQKLVLLDSDVQDPWMKHLEKLPLNVLTIEGTDITAGAMSSIAKIKTLQTLTVARNPIADEGIDEIKDLKLVQLNMAETDITNSGIKKIVRYFPELSTLALMGCPITGDSLEDVATLKNLSQLDFGQISNVTASQVRHLAKAKALYRLNMRRSGLHDDVLEELAKMPNLQQLELDQNEFTDKGLDTLAGMKNLSLIRIGQCKNLTQTALENLKRKRRNCVVDFSRLNQVGVEL